MLLRQLTLPVQAFENMLSYADEIDRSGIKVPDAFLRGWLHLLMGLIYCCQEEQGSWDHFAVLESLMRSCMRKVMDSGSEHSLLDRSVVLPLELVSLASLNLLRDVTGKYWDISDTYSEFLKALVSGSTFSRLSTEPALIDF